MLRACVDDTDVCLCIVCVCSIHGGSPAGLRWFGGDSRGALLLSGAALWFITSHSRARAVLLFATASGDEVGAEPVVGYYSSCNVLSHQSLRHGNLLAVPPAFGQAIALPCSLSAGSAESVKHLPRSILHPRLKWSQQLEMFRDHVHRFRVLTTLNNWVSVTRQLEQRNGNTIEATDQSQLRVVTNAAFGAAFCPCIVSVVTWERTLLPRHFHFTCSFSTSHMT